MAFESITSQTTKKGPLKRLSLRLVQSHSCRASLEVIQQRPSLINAAETVEVKINRPGWLVGHPCEPSRERGRNCQTVRIVSLTAAGPTLRV